MGEICMAQRVATEYKKLVLELQASEMESFIHLFQHAEFETEVRIFENGEKEIVLFSKEEQLPFSFKLNGNKYTCEGACMIRDVKLANQVRIAVRKFKGTAIAHRIYPTYTMIYYYVSGNVIKIVEQKQDRETIVFEYKDTLGDMQRLFEASGVEDEIKWIRMHIDQLLDLRNKRTILQLPNAKIDRQLNELSHQLFILEA